MLSSLPLLSVLLLITMDVRHALPPSSLSRQRPPRALAPRRDDNLDLWGQNNLAPPSSSPSPPLIPFSGDGPSRRMKVRARAATASTAMTRRKFKTASLSATTPAGRTVPTAKNKSSKRDHARASGGAPPPGDEYGYYGYSRKPGRNAKSGAPFQNEEMMDHAILTSEEEVAYARQVVRARNLKMKIEELLEEQRLERESRRGDTEETEVPSSKKDDRCEDSAGCGRDHDFLSYQLEYHSVYGFRPASQHCNAAGFDLEVDLLMDHAQHRSRHMAQLCEGASFETSIVGGESYISGGSPRRCGYLNGSSHLRPHKSDADRDSYTSLLQIPLTDLTESNVRHALGIPGGKLELVDILMEGVYAREMLMRRNIKLVSSIAKSWMRNSFGDANSDRVAFGGGGGETGDVVTAGKREADKPTRRYLSQMYEGSWDRPSLDEVIQEGTLGLARAVDKYDPERGLRLATYATHWITSRVRTCFRRSATGCLRVPNQLHNIKSTYNRILREHIRQGNLDPPDQCNVAKQLGISEKRLATAIRATGRLVSVDGPATSWSGSAAYKGSMASGDVAGGQELLILDTLKCAEPRPEDRAEISFLGQCLENAMAAELTPWERDVVKLRLGLDSGTVKTAREIAEMSGRGVSDSDVRNVERRAFKKLRSPASVHAHGLLAYLDLTDGLPGRRR